MCEVYCIFSKDFKGLDFSESAKLEAYYAESFGEPCKPTNGYMIGKRFMNVTLEMWKEDIKRGYLKKYELLEDDTFPKWWMEKVLRTM